MRACLTSVTESERFFVGYCKEKMCDTRRMFVDSFRDGNVQNHVDLNAPDQAEKSGV